ncbi:MAG: RNA polymerase sigma factor [Desulfitobacteriaceae bacterium]
MIDTDLELIEKVRSGEEEAFAKLVKKYTPYVYRTAYVFMHEEAEAEDVTQEVFIKVYRSISQLKNVQVFNSWFKRMIINACLDQLKKQRPRPVSDAVLEQIPADNLNEWDQHIQIQEGLERLSPEYREALVLREWQGYDYQEIARLLSIPLGTVKSRIHTARTQLRKILSD